MYFKLLGYYLLQQLKIELGYRSNLLIGFFGQILFTLMSLIFIGTFLKFGQTINGWGFYDILLLFGFSDLTFGLASIFIFRTYFSMNDTYIVGGGLDQLLVQPLHPLANIILHNLNITDLIIVLKGIAIILMAVPYLAISWSLLVFLKLIILILAGSMTLAGLLLFIASTGFWLIRRNDAAMAFLSITQLSQYPLSIYPHSVQFFLSFILPLAFTAFYPVQYFLGIHPGDSGFAFSMMPVVLVGLFSFAVAIITFQSGLRRYNSVGS